MWVLKCKKKRNTAHTLFLLSDCEELIWLDITVTWFLFMTTPLSFLCILIHNDPPPGYCLYLHEDHKNRAQYQIATQELDIENSCGSSISISKVIEKINLALRCLFVLYFHGPHIALCQHSSCNRKWARYEAISCAQDNVLAFVKNRPLCV